MSKNDALAQCFCYVLFSSAQPLLCTRFSKVLRTWDSVLWGKVREWLLFKCFSILFEAFAFDEWGAHRKPSKNDMGEFTKVPEEITWLLLPRFLHRLFTMF